jgi:hypothetical protein
MVRDIQQLGTRRLHTCISSYELISSCIVCDVHVQVHTTKHGCTTSGCRHVGCAPSGYPADAFQKVLACMEARPPCGRASLHG